MPSINRFPRRVAPAPGAGDIWEAISQKPGQHVRRGAEERRNKHGAASLRCWGWMSVPHGSGHLDDHGRVALVQIMRGGRRRRRAGAGTYAGIRMLRPLKGADGKRGGGAAFRSHGPAAITSAWIARRTTSVSLCRGLRWRRMGVGWSTVARCAVAVATGREQRRARGRRGSAGARLTLTESRWERARTAHAGDLPSRSQPDRGRGLAGGRHDAGSARPRRANLIFQRSLLQRRLLGNASQRRPPARTAPPHSPPAALEAAPIVFLRAADDAACATARRRGEGEHKGREGAGRAEAEAATSGTLGARGPETVAGRLGGGVGA